MTDLKNSMHLTFLSLPENESFARMAVSAFAVQMNPTLETLTDIKTAVSEAVTNAVVHGYRDSVGEIALDAVITDSDDFYITVSDAGLGIPDIARAMEPFYTTQPEKERSGMGFQVMLTFMDDVQVQSAPGEGTCVRMRKRVERY